VWERVMKPSQADTVRMDHDIPPNLRPFIDVLLEGDCTGHANGAPQYLDAGESTGQSGGIDGTLDSRLLCDG
jgi:hypothetical protein